MERDAVLCILSAEIREPPPRFCPKSNSSSEELTLHHLSMVLESLPSYWMSLTWDNNGLTSLWPSQTGSLKWEIY
jgi:hypothetical protein